VPAGTGYSRGAAWRIARFPAASEQSGGLVLAASRRIQLKGPTNGLRAPKCGLGVICAAAFPGRSTRLLRRFMANDSLKVTINRT